MTTKQDSLLKEFLKDIENLYYKHQHFKIGRLMHEVIKLDSFRRMNISIDTAYRIVKAFKKKQPVEEIVEKVTIENLHSEYTPYSVLYVDLLDVRLYHPSDAMIKKMGSRGIEYPFYYLTCIDAFSRKAWVEPLQRKTPELVLKAFEKVWKEYKTNPFGYAPNFVRGDGGVEFNQIKPFLEKLNIRYLFQKDDTHKAFGIISRFQKLCREYITWIRNIDHSYNYMSDFEKWVSKVYNKSYHSGLNSIPDIVFSLEKIPPKMPIREYKLYPFREGDYVKLRLDRKTFEKRTNPVYSVDNYLLKEIKGVFGKLVNERDPDDNVSKKWIHLDNMKLSQGDKLRLRSRKDIVLPNKYLDEIKIYKNVK